MIVGVSGVELLLGFVSRRSVDACEIKQGKFVTSTSGGERRAQRLGAIKSGVTRSFED
jgi:hypothetical protein